jgi:hypothetical protein
MPSTIYTNKNPGSGWKWTGGYHDGVKVWVKTSGGTSGNPSSGASGGSGTSGYSSSGGSSGGSTGTAEADAKALKERIAAWTKAYWGLVEKAGGKLSKEAKALIEWAAKEKQSPSSAAFLEEMRKKDQEGFLQTAAAEKRGALILPDLKNIFGVDWDLGNKELKALLVKFQLGEPDKLTQQQFFAKYVMKNSIFRTKYASFKVWYKGTGGDQFTAFKSYLGLRQQFSDAYAAKFGRDKPIPPALLDKAIAGNWDLQGKDWLDAIAADSNWGTLTDYNDRLHYFEDQWKSIFGSSQFGELPPPEGIAKKYAQGSMQFDEIFQTSIRDSIAFKTAFPDFELYAQAKFQADGTPIGQIGVGDWLSRRARFMERYMAILEDPTAIPDPALLARAMAGNWSDTKWDLEIEKNDPKYKSTDTYKAKEAQKTVKSDSFDLYWKRLFGENSTPDPTLRGEFVNSASSDVEGLWNKIKNTAEFRSQYAQWDAFAAAQNAQGQNVMEDPALYKQYQKAFYDAFASQGIQAPGGFDRMFFASGIDPDQFTQNLGQFAQQKQSYEWQTGEAPDLATAAGIGDKTAGGSLRKRLDEALKQHQAYAQSKFTNFRTEEVAGNLAQRI